MTLLVIENSTSDLEQITGRLESLGFVVERMQAAEDERLYNYRALHPDSQVIIVDLSLDISENNREGLELIQGRLWEADRTAMFVVYSRWIKADERRALNTVQPHWFFIPKEYQNGRLTDDSLQALSDVVIGCAEISSPTFFPPSFDGHRYLAQIDQYLNANSVHSNSGNPDRVKARIQASLAILKDLADAASYYVRSGARARQLAIGVYGSCGRLESRAGSDIEFSVFYEGPMDDRAALQLGIIFWNRLAYTCISRGWRVEKQREFIDDSKNKVLEELMIRGELSNTYMPVMSVETLLEMDLTKHAELRNRHFQILTELRPIFNHEAVFALKKALLMAGLKLPRDSTDITVIVGGKYFQDVINQFQTDSGSDRPIVEEAELKRFVYRFANIVALRFALVHWLAFRPHQIADDKAWIELFEQLSEPGIVKIARLANEIHSRSRGTEHDRPILQTLDSVMSSYFQLLAQFAGVDRRALTAEAVDSEATQLRPVAEQFARFSIDAFDLLRSHATFATLSVRFAWLFEDSTLKLAARRV